MKPSLLIPCAALAAAMLAACDDTGSIGSDLIQLQNVITIEDGFQITGHSVENQRVQSRTIMQLIGSIDAEEYGSFSSDFVTQFMPVAEIDTTLHAAEDIDSVKLLMMFTNGAFVGDSVIPMGLEVYRLTNQLPAPIFSDFNPADYYDPSPIGSRVYGGSAFSAETDSIAALSYREIYVDLPRSLGLDLFNLYKTDPQAFQTPTAFAAHFPGLYVRNTYGSGRVTKIGRTAIQFFYHYDTTTSAGNDTTYNYKRSFFQATPEIISNNNIDYTISPKLLQKAAQGENLIVAPAGLDVEITFPLKEIIQYYNDNKSALAVINNLSLEIPADKIANTFGIDPPEQILMIKKNKRQSFFENSEITDGINSFYASYDSSTGSYGFSSLRSYLIDALEHQDSLTEEDYTFILTPVVVETESVLNSSYSYTAVIKSIVPYVEQPAMTRLRLEDATVTLTFSHQSLK